MAIEHAADPAPGAEGGLNHPRPRLHVAPPAGRLNDPNGLFVSGETLHVYYQHDPVFPFAHKRTGWAHTTLPLSGGEPHHLPDALHPGQAYDRDGCYSGSAVIDDIGRVQLFYTGNLKEDGVRTPSVNRVFVTDPDGPAGGIHRPDEANPLIDGSPEGYTGHVRDPHVTRVADGGWRMVLGAQRANETGTVVVYTSTDLEHWDFAGEPVFDTTHTAPGDAPDLVPGGYMWECPNLITLTDHADGRDYDVLVVCPQGLDEVEEMDPEHPDVAVTHYASSDQCGYLVGHLTGEPGALTFEVTRGFSELDLGHDFYAPQLIAHPDGDALMLGWMGLPGADEAPTLADGWVHTLTLPRRVRLEAGRLIQEPVLADAASVADVQDVTVDFVAGTDAGVELADTAGTVAVTVTWDAASESVALTRAGAGTRTDTGDGNAADTRVFRCPPGRCRVVVDAGAVEVFAGDGAVAAALTAWPTAGERWAPVRAGSPPRAAG